MKAIAIALCMAAMMLVSCRNRGNNDADRRRAAPPGTVEFIGLETVTFRQVDHEFGAESTVIMRDPDSTTGWIVVIRWPVDAPAFDSTISPGVSVEVFGALGERYLADASTAPTYVVDIDIGQTVFGISSGETTEGIFSGTVTTGMIDLDLDGQFTATRQ